MTLQQFADQNKNIAWQDLDMETGLAVQTKLSEIGLLDPVFGGDKDVPFGPLLGQDDGKIGPFTLSMLAVFCKKAKITHNALQFTPKVAAALAAADAATFYKLVLEPNPKDRNDGPQTKLVMRICKYMLKKGYWIARGPGMYNIAYLEGADKDGTPNADRFNEFNDRRIVFHIRDTGKPEILHNVIATTEPGLFYTKNKLNPNGAARIAFGQYKAWTFGFHQQRSNHPALVQVGNLRVHRDGNEDGKRTGDFIDVGHNFGVNQHMAWDAKLVNKWSAGCLVGQSRLDHFKFLNLLKTDARFKTTKSYKFVSVVIAGDDLAKSFPPA